ncbi:unnamed protein product [Ascophyllum nodosum]
MHGGGPGGRHGSMYDQGPGGRHEPMHGHHKSWHGDDIRIAMTILLIALGWIIFSMRRQGEKKGEKKGWFSGLVSFVFGDRGQQGFARQDLDRRNLASELERAGVTSAGLIVGVDFTRSNEWTGQRCYGTKSMHDVIGEGPNPYQEVLEAIGRGLEPLNASDNIWCYGFGDESTTDESVFCFLPGDEPCKNLQHLLNRYSEIAPAVQLSGPTSFAPLIHKAIEIVEDSGMKYHCLVIIADGQVTKERDTVKAIQKASSYPLSIIMVGVGEGPWDTCRVFDTRLPGRRFNNFRFVEHRLVNRRKEDALMLSALAEVPDQYRAIRALGLIRGLADGPGSSGIIKSVAAHAGAALQGAFASAPSYPVDNRDNPEDEVPQVFACPLTLEVMIDPVVCEDGHSYERGALEAWFSNHRTSPMSNTPLKSTRVVPNHALRNSIEEWRRERGY